MTDREILGVAAIGLPAVAAGLCVLLPRRFVVPVAALLAVGAGVVGLVLALVSVGRPGTRVASTWLVVDPAAGVLLAAISVAVANLAVDVCYGLLDPRVE